MASRPSDERAMSRAEIASSAEAVAEHTAADEAPAEHELELHFRLRRVLRGTSAMFVSTLVHMTAFIVLSLLVIEPQMVREVQEIVSEMIDEPEKELVRIELENQLTEVEQESQEVFSSSPVIAAVGAAGPQGMVSAPPEKPQ